MFWFKLLEDGDGQGDSHDNDDDGGDDDGGKEWRVNNGRIRFLHTDNTASGYNADRKQKQK